MNATIAAAALVTAAVGMGLYLGLLYLRRVRRPVLVGAHLLLGAAGLEATAMLLRGTPDGTVTPAGTFGIVAAATLATTMISGLAAPLVAKRSRRNSNIALGIHASVGVTGFVLFLAWLAGR